MKHLIPTAALIIAASTAGADPVHGLWKTQPDDNGNFGHVEIAECDGKVCGVLRAAFDGSGAPRPSDKIGARIVWNMAPEGDGAYRNGKIYAPDRDKTYNSKMDLAGDRLTVFGCVIGICRDQTWTRVQ